MVATDRFRAVIAKPLACPNPVSIKGMTHIIVTAMPEHSLVGTTYSLTPLLRHRDEPSAAARNSHTHHHTWQPLPYSLAFDDRAFSDKGVGA